MPLPGFLPSTTITSSQNGDWDDPATWGGDTPGSNDVVGITHEVTGTNVSATVNRILLSGSGQLNLDDPTLLAFQDIFAADDSIIDISGEGKLMMLNGEYLAGDTNKVGNVVHTLDNANIILQGDPKLRWNWTTEAIPVGATTINFASALTGWSVGDKLVLPDTKYKKPSATQDLEPFQEWEVVEIQSINGTEVTLTAPTQYDHVECRDSDGNIRVYVPVGNLTCSLEVESETDQFEQRGHVMLSGTGGILIEDTGFINLGRAVIDRDQNDVAPWQMRNVGRYGGPHIHIRQGGEEVRDGFLWVMNRNVCWGDGEAMWGITAHRASWGQCNQNLIFNVTGDGLTIAEDSQSVGCEVHDNLVCHIPGRGGTYFFGRGGRERSTWRVQGNAYHLGCLQNDFQRNVAVMGKTTHTQHCHNVFAYLSGEGEIPTSPNGPTETRKCSTLNDGTFKDNIAIGGGRSYGLWDINATKGTPQMEDSVAANLESCIAFHSGSEGIHLYSVHDTTIDCDFHVDPGIDWESLNRRNIYAAVQWTAGVFFHSDEAYGHIDFTGTIGGYVYGILLGIRIGAENTLIRSLNMTFQSLQNIGRPELSTVQTRGLRPTDGRNVQIIEPTFKQVYGQPIIYQMDVRGKNWKDFVTIDRVIWVIDGVQYRVYSSFQGATEIVPLSEFINGGDGQPKFAKPYGFPPLLAEQNNIAEEDRTNANMRALFPDRSDVVYLGAIEPGNAVADSRFLTDTLRRDDTLTIAVASEDLGEIPDPLPDEPFEPPAPPPGPESPDSGAPLNFGSGPEVTANDDVVPTVLDVQGLRSAGEMNVLVDVSGEENLSSAMAKFTSPSGEEFEFDDDLSPFSFLFDSTDEENGTWTFEVILFNLDLEQTDSELVEFTINNESEEDPQEFTFDELLDAMEEEEEEDNAESPSQDGDTDTDDGGDSDEDTTESPNMTGTIFNRVSARRCNKVRLDATFIQGGVPADPFAIYRVEIFRGKVAECNIIDAIDMVGPDESSYPSPLERQDPETDPISNACVPVGCSTAGCSDDGDTSTDSTAGRFSLIYDVPCDAVVPDVYFDVWYFWATDPREGTEPLTDHLDKLISQCNRFWVYPDQWYIDGGLETIRFGFEPIDQKFHKPEKRPLEIGIMPLPLYDYNYNLVMPLIPFLEPTITIWSDGNEIVHESIPAKMKLRQGAFRSNPWVVSLMLDTCKFLKGTYRYRVTVGLPDGSTRTSGDFFLTIA